jgi:hypothetical protein
MRTSTLRWGLLGLLVMAAGVRDARAVTLRWKFKEGETLHYVMDQKTVTAVKANNLDIKTTLTQKIDMSWIVKGVNDGTADMVQTIDRVRTKIESPVGGAFEFDSSSKDEPKGPIGASLGPLLRALVGAQFSFKMSPQGELSDIKVPEQVTKALREAGAAGGGAGMFSEEGLKNMITESSLGLPAEDLEKGKSWTRQSKVPIPPVGAMTLDKTFTYEGPDPKAGPKIETIGLDTRIGIETTPGNQIELKIKSQEGKGSFLFDNAAGRIIDSNVTVKVDTLITVQNMEIVQSNETSTMMKLVPADSGASK